MTMARPPENLVLILTRVTSLSCVVQPDNFGEGRQVNMPKGTEQLSQAYSRSG